MYPWTDRPIRIHAFYCMLGISLLQHLHKQAQSAWNGISVEQLLEELRQIQQFVLLYPPQGEKGPNRIATVLSKQRPSRSKPWLKPWAWTNCILPNVGNTIRRP
jgi:hypothetical protein